MAETAETLDCDEGPERNVLLTHTVEDSDASTEKRRSLKGVDIFGDWDYCFRSKHDILTISSITFDTVDVFVVAKLEVAATA